MHVEGCGEAPDRPVPPASSRCSGRWTCPSPRSVESDRRTPRVEEHFDGGRPNWHELGDLRTDLVAKLAAELLQRLDIVDRSSQRRLSMVIGSEGIRLPVA